VAEIDPTESGGLCCCIIQLIKNLCSLLKTTKISLNKRLRRIKPSGMKYGIRKIERRNER